MVAWIMAQAVAATMAGMDHSGHDMGAMAGMDHGSFGHAKPSRTVSKAIRLVDMQTMAPTPKLDDPGIGLA